MASSTTGSGAAVRIDDDAAWKELASAGRTDAGEVRELLEKALELKGLRGRDPAVLCDVTDEELLAREVRWLEEQALGVLQISAGSRTNPGGYDEGPDDRHAGQFSLGDHRPLDEVIRDVAALGFVPSFCTACYRLGRTGADFMDVARPGEIKEHCNPNALATFQEYLDDYSSEETRREGEACIARTLAGMEPPLRAKAGEMVALVKSGRRDVFC